MDMQASRSLTVTQQQAWDALNDPQILKTCIPGCNTIKATADNRYDIGVTTPIGPTEVEFTGRLVLSDLQPSHKYTLIFDGQHDGAVSIVKGTARVRLSPTNTGCDLHYTVHAGGYGKFAEMPLGQAEEFGKSMLAEFFRRFDLEMQSRYPAGENTPTASLLEGGDATHAGTSMYQDDKKFPHWVWMLGAVLLLGMWWWTQ